MQDGLDDLTDIGPFLVDGAEVATRETRVIEGRNAMRSAGTGRRDGRAVSFAALVIDLPGSRVAVSVLVLDSRARPEMAEAMKAIYASFRIGGMTP